MKLFYRKKGETGEPLIILHGLYGSGDNWLSITRGIQEHFRIYLIDQRNHGRSPHSEDMNYDLLSGDLLEFLNDREIEKANIIGHSMGGKTAMWFGFKYPERINKLIVADIAPKTYRLTDSNAKVHKLIVSALRSAEPETAKERKEIEERLNNKIPNPQLTMFLLKNIERRNDGTYHWRININSLDRNLEKILNSFSNIASSVYFPTLFIKGELSNYIRQGDLNRIKQLYPNSVITTIPDAGHWLHAQQPKLFVKTVLGFLL